MTATTNVPSITITSAGVQLPAESAILAGAQADLSAAFASQGTLNFATTSGGVTVPTGAGQIANSQTACYANANAAFATVANMMDPAYATGRFQDAIGRIYFQTRIAAVSTTLQLSCIGVSGTIIPLDASIQDGSGNIYLCTTAGTIPLGGSVTLSFAAAIPGPTAVPTSVSIYQSVSGWDTVTLISGTIGSNAETRIAFEQRRQRSVASNSVGQNASIQGAILALPGVTDCYVYSNDSGSPVTIQSVVIPANALYVAVVGGVSSSIASTILTKKMPGAPYYSGNTTVSVPVTSGYVTPYPTYSVTYNVPSNLPIVVAVTIASTPAVPSNATALIQAGIVAAFSGGDQGAPVRIAGELRASRFYQTLMSATINGETNPYYLSWAQIVQIQIGSINSPASSFTGRIDNGTPGNAGTTLTVAGSPSPTGTIAVGQSLCDAAGNIILGTTITGLGSGSGGAGTYTVSTSQSVASETIYGVTAGLSKITPHLDQYPVTATGLISVTLS